MSWTTVICPQCHVGLRSNKPLPAVKTIRCLRCGHQFQGGHHSPITTAPLPVPWPPITAPAAPRLTRVMPPLTIALCAALFVVGGGIAAILFLNREPPAQASHDDRDRRHAEEKRQLEDKRRLEEERQKLADERKTVADERKKLQFSKLLVDADAALAAKEYGQAKKLYSEAAQSFPADANVKAGLVKSEAGLMVVSQAAEEREKRQAEYTRLMTLGKERMDGKDYAAAVQAFEAALQSRNGVDALASKALADARDAQGNDQAEKKKRAEYNLQMETGRISMLAQHYDDAVKAYLAALQVVPGDPAATRALANAQKRLGDLADADKRQKAFLQAMDHARAARRDRKFDVAIAALEQALRLRPGDREAEKALRETRKAKVEARSEFTQQMTQGDFAVQSGRFTEAFRCFKEAVRIIPEDQVAGQSLARVEQLLEKMSADRNDYLRLMAAGQVALTNMRWVDALAAFNAALLIAPNDADALRGLAQARGALDQTARVRAEFNWMVQEARAALWSQPWPMGKPPAGLPAGLPPAPPKKR